MCVNIFPLLNLVIETNFTGSALETDNKNTPEFKECLKKTKKKKLKKKKKSL